jgi:Fur family ferric uptake transcriptional regulator
LICRICGRLVDVECAIGSAPCLTAVDDMGYEIDEAEIAYWGRCSDCLAQARAPSDPPTRRRRSQRRDARTEGPTIPSRDREENPPD